MAMSAPRLRGEPKPRKTSDGYGSQFLRERQDAIVKKEGPRDSELLWCPRAATELIPGDRAHLKLGFGLGQL